MPIYDSDLDKLPIWFHKPGEATVIAGPCSAMAFKEKKIPLDGRHYGCAGKVILRNGTELRTDLRIQTHNFDFLEPDGVCCRIDGAWYQLSERELLVKLGLKFEEAFPCNWLPDVPLDYHEPGPYPVPPQEYMGPSNMLKFGK